VAYQSRWDEAEELATRALEILVPSIGLDAPESISCKQLLDTIEVARQGNQNGFGAQGGPLGRSTSSSSSTRHGARRGRGRKPRSGDASSDPLASPALVYTLGIVAGALAGLAAVLFVRALRKSSEK
jgi:hypothetical protein